jgi:hypothetical protein
MTVSLRRSVVHLFFGLIAILFLSSCEKEEIRPAFTAKTLRATEQGNFLVSIPIQELVVVEEFGQDIGEVPVVGGIFQELARHFANITIDEQSGTEVPVSPYVYQFNELDRVDFGIISRLALERVQIRVAEDDNGREANLKFIKRIEVYLSFDAKAAATGEDGLAPRIPLAGSLMVLSFDKAAGIGSIGCLNRCIDLKIHPLDWRKILEKNRSFVMQTRIVVDGVPQSNMHLTGSLAVGLGLDLGF